MSSELLKLIAKVECEECGSIVQLDLTEEGISLNWDVVSIIKECARLVVTQ
jgi:hypothetical protein